MCNILTKRLLYCGFIALNQLTLMPMTFVVFVGWLGGVVVRALDL